MGNNKQYNKSDSPRIIKTVIFVIVFTYLSKLGSRSYPQFYNVTSLVKKTIISQLYNHTFTFFSQCVNSRLMEDLEVHTI